MKTCKYCGNEISDNLEVCPFCNAVQDEQKEKNDDTAYSQMARFLKYEHIAWKAGGFISLGAGALYCGIALLFVIIGFIGMVGSLGNAGRYISYPENTEYVLPFAMMIYIGFIYLFAFLIGFLPIVIVNFIMVKKVEFYQGCMESDIAVTRTRCRSVGMMVFAAIFNKVALVFIIINFVKTRTHAAEFDRIEAKQKASQKEAE